MKLMYALSCIVLLTATPVASQDRFLRLDGIGAGAAILSQVSDDNRRNQHGNRNGNPPVDDRPGTAREDVGSGGRGDKQRDNRINRAIDIARSSYHGRVLNAWPLGGSLFTVRIDTGRGRVDLTVDVDSGRIVQEK